MDVKPLLKKNPLKRVGICPECKNVQGTDSKIPKPICSECWIKTKKRVVLKPGIFRKGWDRVAFEYNNTSLISKIQKYAINHLRVKNIETGNLSNFKGEPPFITFAVEGLHLEDLENLFNYWNVSWKEWVRYVGVNPRSKDTILVTIALVSEPDFFACEHAFTDRRDWGHQICKKCGLFDKKLSE